MADLRERVQEAVGSRYEIERELGRGGMATVFLVRDLKHGRRVAMKVLREDISATLGAPRFLREIEIVAQLQHPHILPLHDSGEAAGMLFYVMPYAEGKSLRDRLTRDVQLTVDETVQIGREVADALAYAHARHVVHRDVKPENILLLGGHAVVADFGIARAITQSGTTFTDAGFIMGTAAYMAPEQASGAAALDGRVDTYALGCVLHECLTGRPPFQGESIQAVLAMQLTTPAPPVRKTRPNVPEPLESVLLRALEKDPARRFATAGEFGDALAAIPTTTARASSGRTARLSRTVGGVGIAFAVVAGLGIALSRRMRETPGTSADTAVRSVAVLPLRTMSAEQQDQYFADGMSEELTGVLAKVAGLRVAPRSSAFAFRNQNLPSNEVGRRLNVDAVIDGSIQRSGSQLRLRAQLVRVDNDSVLWSESYSRSVADVLAVQEELARAIVGQLSLTISPSTSTVLVRRVTVDPQAYDLYLQGRWYLARRARESLTRAIGLFEQVVRRDSNFALAYSGLGDASGLLGAYGDVTPRDAFERARTAAGRALALDSLSAEPNASVGFIALFYERDWVKAERALDRALQLDSTYGFARVLRGWTYMVTGRPNEAVAELERGRRIEPLSLLVATRLGSMLYYARRFPEAETQLRNAVALDPTYTLAHAELAHVLAARGRPDEAIQEMEQTPDFRMRYEGASIGYALARAGRVSAARQHLDERLQRRAATYLDPGAIALIYVGLGDKDRAMEMLEHGVVERPWSMALLGIDPLWDSIRGDSRFQSLLTRLRRP